MKNRIVVLAGVAALVVAATVFAVAQGIPGHPRGDGHGDMVEHLSLALNLTDAQKTQVKAIVDAERATSEPARSRIGEIHKQVEAALFSGQFDEAQIRPLAAQASQLMTDQMVEHVRAFAKIYALLTPEQRVKAQEMHKRMGPGGMHGPMGHRPPPGQ